jgi:hypothetical protein
LHWLDDHPYQIVKEARKVHYCVWRGPRCGAKTAKWWGCVQEFVWLVAYPGGKRVTKGVVPRTLSCETLDHRRWDTAQHCTETDKNTSVQRTKGETTRNGRKMMVEHLHEASTATSKNTPATSLNRISHSFGWRGRCMRHCGWRWRRRANAFGCLHRNHASFHVTQRNIRQPRHLVL